MSDLRSRECPFCLFRPERALAENDLAVALPDAFPVSDGHALIVSRRHVANFFDLSTAEVAAVMDLLFRIQLRLTGELDPGGFNVGVNVGVTAGQTIMHAHVHLIPRFPGDVDDPRGGVRNIISGEGPYP
jgi:diadenosine tetraphosphate (Ap4A) HIT family hydrolase